MLLPSIKIEQMPILTTNLTLLRSQVSEYLANFNFIITDDGLKFAREKAAELKKAADVLDDIRKKIVVEASAPISAFDAEAKAIVEDILGVRESLTSQVKAMQAAELDKLSSLLASELESLWNLHGVEKEFRKASTDGLLLLGNMTDGGRLTKKATDTLAQRVLADKALQDKINGRLLTLDGICLKAGLVAPFRRHNIEHFLFAPDEVYEKSLNGLIDAEIKRQEETEARIKAQAQAKAQREIEAIAARAEAEKKALEEANQKAVQAAIAEAQKTTQTQPLATPKVPANNIPPKDGNVKYVITVHMEMEYKDMEVAKLEQAVMKKFNEAGFKSVQGVEIEKVTAQQPVIQKEKPLMAAGSFF